jgi:hypothetical protein
VLGNPTGERGAVLGTVRQCVEVVIDDVVPGTVVFGSLRSGKEQQRAVRLHIDSGPTIQVVSTGQLGMPGDVEVSAPARCLDLGIDADAKSVEHLPGLLHIGTVARVNVDGSDIAAHRGHDG